MHYKQQRTWLYAIALLGCSIFVSFPCQAEGTWSTKEFEIGQDDGVSYMPRIASTTNGDFLAVWKYYKNNISSLYYSVYSGGKWGAPQLLSSIGESIDYPEIVTDKNGFVYAAWKSKVNFNGPAFIVKTSVFKNGAWSSPAILGDTGYYSTLSLKSGEDSAIHAAWQINDYSPTDVGTTTYANSTWSPLIRLNTPKETTRSPVVTSDAQGNKLAVWVSSDVFGSTLKYAYYNKNTWSSEGVIAKGAGVLDRFISHDVVADKNGGFVVAWVREDGINNKASMESSIFNNGNWGEIIQVSNPRQYTYSIALQADNGGGASLVWKSTNNVEHILRYSSYTNGGWGPVKDLPIGPLGILAVLPVMASSASSEDKFVIWASPNYTNTSFPSPHTVRVAQIISGEWGNPVEIGKMTPDSLGPDKKEDSPKLAVDEFGNAMAVWISTDYGRRIKGRLYSKNGTPPVKYYTLTVQRSGLGTVTTESKSIDCGIRCTKDFEEGSSVQLTATPDSDYKFAGWDGACAGTGTCVVSMSRDTTVIAKFTALPKPPEPAKLRLTVGLITGNGRVVSYPAGIDCGARCTSEFYKNSVVTLTATPNAGATFKKWGGNCVGKKPTCRIKMNKYKIVRAIFK